MKINNKFTIGLNKKRCVTKKKNKKRWETNLLMTFCKKKKKAFNDLSLVYNVEEFLEVSHRHNPSIRMNQV